MAAESKPSHLLYSPVLYQMVMDINLASPKPVDRDKLQECHKKALESVFNAVSKAESLTDDKKESITEILGKLYMYYNNANQNKKRLCHINSLLTTDPSAAIIPTEIGVETKSVTPEELMTQKTQTKSPETVSQGESITGLESVSEAEPVISTESMSPVEFITLPESVSSVESITPPELVSPVEFLTPPESISPPESASPVSSSAPVESVVPPESVSLVNSVTLPESAITVESVIPSQSVLQVDTATLPQSETPKESVTSPESLFPVTSASPVESVTPPESVSPVTSGAPLESATPPESVSSLESITSPECVSSVESVAPPESVSEVKSVASPNSVSTVEFIAPPETVPSVDSVTPPESISQVDSVTIPNSVTPPGPMTPPESVSPPKPISAVKSVTSQESVVPAEYVTAPEPTSPRGSSSEHVDLGTVKMESKYNIDRQTGEEDPGQAQTLSTPSIVANSGGNENKPTGIICPYSSCGEIVEVSILDSELPEPSSSINEPNHEDVQPLTGPSDEVDISGVLSIKILQLNGVNMPGTNYRPEYFVQLRGTYLHFSTPEGRENVSNEHLMPIDISNASTSNLMDYCGTPRLFKLVLPNSYFQFVADDEATARQWLKKIRAKFQAEEATVPRIQAWNRRLTIR